ncbi:MAG: hypothetical protein IPN59_04120 [Holophaga sp.]|nr:hypothetical protein [Holophaga sp.]
MNNGINILPFYISSSTNPTAFQQGNPLSMGARVQNNHLTPLDAATLMGNAAFQDTVRINLMDPEVKMARARAISLGVEHEMGNGFQIGVRATFKKFANLQYATNINLGQYNSLTAPTTDPNAIYNDGYPTTTNRFSTSARPGRAIVRGRLLDLTGFGDVSLSRYDGEGRYRSLVIELNRRADNGWGFKSNVTFGKSEDNNSNERATLTNSSVYTPNPASPLEAYALSDNDRQMRGVLASIAPGVFGIKISGIFTYSTGLPWTATYSTDQNGDGQSLITCGAATRCVNLTPRVRYANFQELPHRQTLQPRRHHRCL